jgi:hypothetical protein
VSEPNVCRVCSFISPLRFSAVRLQSRSSSARTCSRGHPPGERESSTLHRAASCLTHTSSVAAGALPSPPACTSNTSLTLYKTVTTRACTATLHSPGT